MKTKKKKPRAKRAKPTVDRHLAEALSMILSQLQRHEANELSRHMVLAGNSTDLANEMKAGFKAMTALAECAGLLQHKAGGSMVLYQEDLDHAVERIEGYIEQIRLDLPKAVLEAMDAWFQVVPPAESPPAEARPARRWPWWKVWR